MSSCMYMKQPSLFVCLFRLFPRPLRPSQASSLRISKRVCNYTVSADAIVVAVQIAVSRDEA